MGNSSHRAARVTAKYASRAATANAELLLAGATSTEVYRALSALTGTTRKLSRTSRGRVILILPRGVAAQYGLETAPLVMLEADAEGYLRLRPLSLADVAPPLRGALERAAHLPARQVATDEWEPFEVNCRDCGAIITTRFPQRRYCDDCQARRHRDSARVSAGWKRALKRARPARVGRVGVANVSRVSDGPTRVRLPAETIA
jgi:hypothetical protein